MVVVDPKIFARTERLLLRPLRLEDAEDVVLMRKHPEVMMHTSILPSDDIEKTRDWIQGVRISPPPLSHVNLVGNIQPPGAYEGELTYERDAVIGRLEDPRSLLGQLVILLSLPFPSYVASCGTNSV
jgi:hypothetical protein